MTGGHDSRGLGASAAVGAIALVVRAVVVGWAGERIAPVADGTYYHQIAVRISEGNGYTWLWPDGAVTYAAHYPVGYPALVGGAYAVLGPHPAVAMWINAVLGVMAAVCIHRLVLRVASERRAIAAGVLAAVHPALLLYTPALMTEGVVASLIAIASLLAVRVRERRSVARLAALGAVIGIATLVRPQSILVAPLFAAIAMSIPSLRAWRMWLGPVLRSIAIVTSVALLMCAPWTLRNCDKMDRCALVSVNGGWNLLIGAGDGATGAWSPVGVPPVCQAVWDEADKDACFGREARRMITARPGPWLALVPKKLGATFDYAGAGPWYLHASNPEAFPEDAKRRWGAIETVLARALLLLALLATLQSGRAGQTRWRWGLRVGVAVVGAAFALHLHAWIAYIALALGLALAPPLRTTKGEPIPLLGLTASALAMTALVHAVFFGAGRYSLVVFPLVVAVAALARTPRRLDFDMRLARPAS